ncbi:hypothetical protein CEUSTIGMA_g12373.t1 [Chlamydomonas eustigma]|uniref:Nudix hydrolase domain-containing protein n=1 Tax=Chlamydomonas eustigma TaxID=1157962 RepID=A0A250XPU7_9CHLO|nr:hypothetical protein CEUSTIGMA_g12373.t1 [Chlamydomonas eustigma]|eukprot:GAX84952.1 hypothetical protein CEUSTIGMA_g12373.t1 [Chlamydomonas eustigma]
MSTRPIFTGVGVILVKEVSKHILVGRRKGSHGSGTFALPGGHLEYGEKFEECAAREVLEETGITLRSSDIKFAYATTDVFQELQKQYVTIFMQAQVPEETKATLVEPEKCESWEWVPWGSLPSPLFKPLQTLTETTFSPDGL